MKYKSPYSGLDHNNAIFLATNENPYGLDPVIQQELSKLLSATNRYPMVENLELKNEIAKLYGAAPGNIVLGAGSDELLMLAALCFVDSGDNTIMAFPSFFRYKQVTELARGTCKTTTSTTFCHDLAAMRDLIDVKTKMIFICNPNNPTGTLLSAGEIEEFLQDVPKNVIVLVDEAYFDYVWPSDTKPALSLAIHQPNVLVLRSFSKFYSLAGLRIGYAIGHEDLVSRLNGIRSPYSINSIAQTAALLVLKDTQLNYRIAAENHKERLFYYHAFESLGLNYVESQANFIFVEFGPECGEIVDRLRQDNIVVRRCDIFGLPDYVRITIGTPQENRAVVSCLTQILSRE